MTELREDIAPEVEDPRPSWCVGCDEGEAFHATEFEGPDGSEPDTDAIARLVQEGDAEPMIDLGANDADGDSACVRLSLAQARELADLLDNLITAAELG
jgi:hypothetical protein